MKSFLMCVTLCSLISLQTFGQDSISFEGLHSHNYIKGNNYESIFDYVIPNFRYKKDDSFILLDRKDVIPRSFVINRADSVYLEIIMDNKTYAILPWVLEKIIDESKILYKNLRWYEDSNGMRILKKQIHLKKFEYNK